LFKNRIKVGTPFWLQHYTVNTFNATLRRIYLGVYSSWWVYLQGFGFVTFAHSCDADVVLRRLNGTVIEGRKIEVCHCRCNY